MTRDGVNNIVDLASGAGGPIPIVAEEIRRLGFDLNVTFTDRFPNPAATPFRYCPEPVDARRIHETLAGIRTMFASFHHFRPDEAGDILRDAFDRRTPICIFEATSRPAAVTAVLIPLLVLVLTPKVRPVSWTQIVFTYLVPILPLLIFWDGLVSHLRTYSATQLGELTHAFAASDYVWQTGTHRPQGAPFGFPYLIGRPAQAP